MFRQERPGQQGSLSGSPPPRKGSLLEQGQTDSPGALPVVKTMVAAGIEHGHPPVHHRFCRNRSDRACVPGTGSAVEKVAVLKTMPIDAISTQPQLSTEDVRSRVEALSVHHIDILGPTVLEDARPIDLPVRGIFVVESVNRQRGGPMVGVGTGGPTDRAFPQDVGTEVAHEQTDSIVPEEQIVGVKTSQPVHVGGEFPPNPVG